METKTERRLKAEVVKWRALARDRLGEGILGLYEEKDKVKDKFTHEEIVFIFARIFPYLGFNHIKEVRTNFPDCIAVLKEGREVGIEFEPVLSSFGDHIQKQDNLDLCQYIVCWKDDDVSSDGPIWEEITKFNIEIIQLKVEYEKIKPRGRRPIQDIDIDKLKLKPSQLKILKAFIHLGRNVLTKEEIAEETGIQGKLLGSPLGSFTLLQKSRHGVILTQHSDGKWELNPQHNSKIIAKLKREKMY